MVVPTLCGLLITDKVSSQARTDKKLSLIVGYSRMWECCAREEGTGF